MPIPNILKQVIEDDAGKTVIGPDWIGPLFGCMGQLVID